MSGRFLQPVVFKVNLVWCLSGKRLMRSLCVVKIYFKDLVHDGFDILNAV
jgi:hypothetical protein